jgi:hypothetical protein
MPSEGNWRGVSIHKQINGYVISSAVALVIGGWLPCRAAEIDIRPLGGFTLIELSGDLEKGDASLFAERTTNVSKAVVMLRSDGDRREWEKGFRYISSAQCALCICMRSGVARLSTAIYGTCCLPGRAGGLPC